MDVLNLYRYTPPSAKTIANDPQTEKISTNVRNFLKPTTPDDIAMFLYAFVYAMRPYTVEFSPNHITFTYQGKVCFVYDVSYPATGLSAGPCEHIHLDDGVINKPAFKRMHNYIQMQEIHEPYHVVRFACVFYREMCSMSAELRPDGCSFVRGGKEFRVSFPADVFRVECILDSRIYKVECNNKPCV